MTAGIIVFLTLLFGGLFTLVYLLRPDIRKQVEKPKYDFQSQIQQYNSHPKQINETVAHHADE
ncbi:MAG: hypothetical protein HOI35_08575 [Woeseia sp.]|nr:hypothetical protein [Woeseia sp.]